MAKAYLVTSGDYSDYRIHRIFLGDDGKAEAEKFCETARLNRRYADYDIDEWHVTEKAPNPVNLWVAQYNRRTDEVAEPYSITYWDDEITEYRPIKEDPEVIYNGAFSTMTVKSFDRERALKIVSDKAAEVRARNAGIA